MTEHASDTATIADLIARARSWAQDDPDPVTAAQIHDLLERIGHDGDPQAGAELADRFSGMLEFGTAGLRGALGGGPNRMNRAVVIRAAAGLTAYLAATTATGPTVVIGYDARHNSDVFARDTAAVVTAAGGRALILPRPLPTPVLAFAIRHVGADAGVMVTASHNPAQDNGYKVYLGDGSQIVPPVDAEIAAQIARISTVASVPRADGGWQVLGEDLVEDYIDAMASVVDPGSPRELTVVHTSLHGVGDRTLRAAFSRAGFPEPIVVAGQADPDPEFPTVVFPNPEEAGAIDAALELARRVGPDLVIANDPDADRCAAAVLDPALGSGPDSGLDSSRGEWRMLRGDELGALLGHHSLRRGVPADAVLANSIVSSRLLAAMAAAAGVRHEETLTGFKWISRVPGLAYGYEEALGYCVAPDLVRDKDGISAALRLAELAATLRRDGRTLLDVLDDLAVAHGVHATDSFSVRVADLVLIAPVMHRLRTEPPSEVGGLPVARVDDLARGDGGLPPTEGLRWFLTDDTRVIVRPSGTEPKLKVYLEVIEPVGAGEQVGPARERAALRLASVRADLEQLTRTR